MTKVSLVGCGLVGGAWAVVFARAGLDATLYDPSPSAIETALRVARESAEALAKNGLTNGKTADEIMARLTPAASLAEAAGSADYIQESAPERLLVKQDLYKALLPLVQPHAIVASSTSGLPASAFTERLTGRERCVVAHPINPPHLIPLVEIVPTPWTDPAVVTQTEALMRQVGQSPIVLAREIDGFVVNRLQSAVLAEAFRLVEDGICSAAAVDAAMSEGLGLRWAFMGPFETIDLNAQGGIADYCMKLGPMYHDLAQAQADPRPWSPELIAAVEVVRRAVTPIEALDDRKAWRDRSLAALVCAKRAIMSGQGAVGSGVAEES